MTESRRPKDVETHIGNHKLDAVDADDGLWLRPGAVAKARSSRRSSSPRPSCSRRAADGKRFFEGITGKRGSGGKAEGLVYSRFNGPNQEILEDRLRLGGRRGRADLLQRHDGDRDPAAGLRPAGRRDRPFRPALCRDRRRSSTRSWPVRRPLHRLPGRRDARGDRRGHGPRQGHGPASR